MEASAGFDDVWTFLAPRVEPCPELEPQCSNPTSWSFDISYDVHGSLVNNLIFPFQVEAYSTLTWGGLNSPDLLSVTHTGDGISATGIGGWIQNTPGTQEIDASGTWTFTVEWGHDFILTPTVNLRAQAVVSTPNLLAPDQGFTSSSHANFFNSAGFSFLLPEGVTFSSASGVRAVSAVPEPSSLLLMGSGLFVMGLYVWRRERTRVN